MWNRKLPTYKDYHTALMLQNQELSYLRAFVQLKLVDEFGEIVLGIESITTIVPVTFEWGDGEHIYLDFNNVINLKNMDRTGWINVEGFDDWPEEKKEWYIRDYYEYFTSQTDKGKYQSERNWKITGWMLESDMEVVEKAMEFLETQAAFLQEHFDLSHQEL